jgi:hypothetical protein
MTLAKSKTIQTPQADRSVAPHIKILQMMNAYRLTQAISVAAKLGIADLLAKEAQTSQELAAKTGTHSFSLYRLLRALASFEIFAEDETGKFSLTPRGALLQKNIPGSLRAYGIVQGQEWHWQMWGGIMHSVKTGEPVFDRIYGIDFNEYYKSHPEAAEVFDAAMVGVLGIADLAIAESYDFSSFELVVDVAMGGQGDGKLIAHVLKQYPTLQGIYFDLVDRIMNVANYINKQGLAQRCEVEDGDVLTKIPAGGDLYIIKNLIHDYDDDSAIQILQECHQAIAPDGKILVIEMLVSPENEMSLAKIVDVEAMIMTAGAKERTEEEYKDLFDRAGFQLTRIIPTRSPMSILEGMIK